MNNNTLDSLSYALSSIQKMAATTTSSVSAFADAIRDLAATGARLQDVVAPVEKLSTYNYFCILLDICNFILIIFSKML